MKRIEEFPFEAVFSKTIDILKLTDEDFPFAIGDDFLRDDMGEIYQTKPDDIMPSSPIDKRFKTVTVLSTECDITEVSASAATMVLGSKYMVMLPFIEDIPLKRGMSFESEMYGLRINGEVLALFAGQLGCRVYVSDKDN